MLRDMFLPNDQSYVSKSTQIGEEKNVHFEKIDLD